MAEQGEDDAAEHQQRGDDGDDVAGAFPGFGGDGAQGRAGVRRDVEDEARRVVGQAPGEQLAERGDGGEDEGEEGEDAQAA